MAAVVGSSTERTSILPSLEAIKFSLVELSFVPSSLLLSTTSSPSVGAVVMPDL